VSPPPRANLTDEEGAPEPHFTEGEPDIEPPEEFAMGELDDLTVLEEELDNEDVLEQDVEEDLLEETLEELVHSDDEDEDEEPEQPVGLVVTREAEGDEEDEELGADDVEEPLDLVLEHRLALDAEAAEPEEDEESAEPSAEAGHATRSVPDVLPRGPEEFTCSSCFLVRSYALLADAEARLCRDCAG